MEIKRQTGLSYQSALFMMHRIRLAMAEDPATPPKLTGTVEVDETFVGGKPRNKHGRGKIGPFQKAPVMVLVERGGAARAFPIDRVTSFNLQQAIRQNVAPSARIMTDSYKGYPGVGVQFAGGHHSVNHSQGEYVRGDVHSNTAESFFAIFKRGLTGVYHSVSRHHLHRYASEFAFRYTNRKMDDGARTALAIRKAQGKRLIYRASVRKKPA